MPQGRRKVPFSGKAKKLQLHQKRVRKGGVPLTGESSNSENELGKQGIMKINAQPHQSKSSRYALHFFKESEEVIKKCKEDAHSTVILGETLFEANADEYYSHGVDFPKRPSWSHDMSREELELSEQRYFREYISKVEESCGDISFFDLNLETWRQFWRVLEMSDVLLIIVDIRYPSLMFPPSLYDYVTKTLGKSIILVLNKVDLVQSCVLVSWKIYFKEKFPSMRILLFTSFPQYGIRKNIKKPSWHLCDQTKKKKVGAEVSQALLNICAELVDGKVDLTPWQNKISQEINENDGSLTVDAEYVQEEYIPGEQYEIFRQGILTIGCIGFPNAGKSSVMNTLVGRKVVSTSKTPGHTKYFQTIYVAPTVKLCDCPGLVFPSLIPKYLQVLMGSFPVAQLREPYSTIKFLAENVNLVNYLSLQHPTGDTMWSAYDICIAWANKRGYFTAKSARPDTYRAANHILRLALDGKITFMCYPPGYFDDKDFWENHDDIKSVLWIYGELKSTYTNVPGTLSGSEESMKSDTENSSHSSGERDEDDDPGTSQKNKFAVLRDD